MMHSARSLANPLQMDLGQQMSFNGGRLSNREITGTPAHPRTPSDSHLPDNGNFFSVPAYATQTSQRSMQLPVHSQTIFPAHPPSGSQSARGPTHSHLASHPPPNHSFRRMPTLDDLTNDPAHMFENYQRLETEIERKKARIAELNGLIKNVRMSTDDQHVQRLQNDIRKTREDIAAVRAKIKQLEVEKTQRAEQIKLLDAEIATLNSQLKREENLGRTLSSLQGELGQAKSELARLNTEFATTEENAIRKMEQEFRQKTSEKMFNLVMQAASRTDDPQVREAFLKLQPKWAPEE